MSTSRRDLRTSGDLVMAPRVPHGLAAAVEGLTREVIRHRPEDIYVFAAQHFEELLKLRDEYGAVTNLPGKSATNSSALREMNKSLKKRSGVDKIERGRWSMDETARVLERHRSIFGDKGRKVSTDEVRALGNEKENKSDLELIRRRPGSNERFIRRKITPKENSSDAARNPKIISQIPTLNQAGGLLAKDIKSELRKNRNSSRDRKGMRERTERKTMERLGATKKTLTRSSRETSLDKLTENDGDGSDRANNQKRMTDTLSKIPRTLSMDRVRDFVVKKFRSSESWEELSSSNYVERVQEVIDDAAPSILKKVNELTTRSAGRSGRGYDSVDESTSTSTRSDKSNQTDDVRSRSAMSGSRRSRKSRRTTKSKTSGADSLEGIETLASETEQAKETGSEKELTKIKSSAESEASSSPNLSLPAVRPPSSKNQSRSVSRSDSDHLVLPPISPEAPKSAKLREELILPSLQISREVVKDLDEVELMLPDPPTDEIFKDSLNVTPDIGVSPRPDSLEPDAVGVDIVADTASASVSEKLMEIQEAEERLNSILDSGQNENVELGMKEKLIEIEETERRIESIFKPEIQEVQEINKEIGMKERLMEIEESEKRIEKILDIEAQGVQENGMKEKLMEIEDTEKRIEKIFKSKAQDVQEDERENGVKEKLIEIQESEKRIEKILNPDANNEIQEDKEPATNEQLTDIQESEMISNHENKSDKNDAGFMKDKLMEIEEAEKRLRNVFDSTSDKESKHNLNQNLKAIHSAPKTPFIPEIPSEYVTSANEVVATPDEVKHAGESNEDQLPGESNNADDSNVGLKDTDGPGVEIISSGTPDSLGTSYVLTEGSPYEIPDSVTTVIIPERQVDTPSSDIVEIVLEDYDEAPFKKSDEEHVTLRNILDNFGEIVDPETPLGLSPTDVDFIKNLKTPTDVVITRKDLDQIREEEDKDVAETEAASIALADIAESEEILEEKVEDPQSMKKHEESLHLEGAKAAFEDRNTETSGSLDPEEPLDLKIINITDSGTTESTDEVKETTISDDGGNTAAESSVTSPSCGGDVEARNSESSNEVKETTISDQPVDGNGKNLLSLAPQCFGSMPHVPELNLDSLQDITVSSFQLSDDQTAEEDSEAAPPQSGNEASYASQDREPIHEDTIVKERIAVKEDPCTKVNTYVTEPDTDSSGIKDTVTLDSEQAGREESEEKAEGKECRDEPEDTQEERSSGRHTVEGVSAETEPGKEFIEVHEEVAVTVPEESSKDASEKEAEEISEDAKEIVLIKKDPEDVAGKSSEEVHEDVSNSVSEESSENILEKKAEEKSEDIHEMVLEKKPEEVQEKTSIEVVKEVITEKKSEELPEKIVEVVDVTKMVINDGPEQVREEEVIEEVIEKTLDDGNVSGNVTKKSSEIELEKVTDEVDEKMPKQEVEKVSKEEPDEILKDVTKIMVLEEGPGKEPETIRDEASKNVIETLHEAELEEIHINAVEKAPEENVEEVLEEYSAKVVEKLPEGPEEGHEKEVENNSQKESELEHEEVLETVSHQLAGEKTGNEPEEIHEEVDEILEHKTEEELEEKHEEKHEVKHVEKHEELLDELTKDVTRQEPEEVDVVSMEKVLEESLEKKPEEILIVTDDAAKSKATEDPEEAVSKSAIIQPTAPPAELEEETSSSDGKAKEPKVKCENDHELISTSISSVPEVASSTSLEEAVDRPASVKLDDHVAFLDPPKAEVVTNDLDDYQNSGERMEYHIYVPEVIAAGSQDENSTTESSTFNSAATKIQAGVRGFLTRRRLQSAQRRSSTLDSVPSIQDSVAADASHLEPIEEVGLAQAATTIQSNYRGYKARQRLHREDAVQKNTMSVENAFSGNGLQHTGEFHDCIPLPLLHLEDIETRESQDLDSSHENIDVNESMKKETQDVNFVDSTLQSQYLNFITSIEEVPDETDRSIIQDGIDTSKAIEVFSLLKSTAGIESLPLDNPSVDSNVSVREPLAVPGTPTALIIEELSKTEDDSLPAAQVTDSLDLPGLSLEASKSEEKEKEKEPSLGTMSFSMNVDDMLGLGAESDPTSKMKPILEVTVTPRDLLKLSNMSTSGDRVESPVTMMQIVPKSMEDDKETEVDANTSSVDKNDPF